MTSNAFMAASVGPASLRTVSRGSRWIDAALIFAISAFIAFGSTAQRVTGFNTPDSEFYASYALFGGTVADRAIEPAYTWTRLGSIAPSRALVLAFGENGLQVWRWVLILVVVASMYVMVRLHGSRLLAVAVAVLASLGTMVLGFAGNTYLTFAVMAGVLLLVMIGVWGALTTSRWPWLPPVLAGGVLGWLVMINPYGALLGVSMWAAVRGVGFFRTRLRPIPTPRQMLVRDLGMVLLGFVVVMLAFLAAGVAIFPGRDWFATYLTWNSKLDYASFIGDATTWQRDIALLLPIAGIGVGVVAVVARRTRWSAVALAVPIASVVFTLVYFLLVRGPWLEAPTYVALLWPGFMAAVALSASALLGHRDLGIAGWGTLVIGAALVIWVGRWDGTLPYVTGVLLAVVVVALMGVIAVISRAPVAAQLWERILVGIAVIGCLVGIAVIGQFAANGRGLLGTYGQYPMRAAYVDFDASLLQQSRIDAERWVLDHTSDTDRIAVWTDSARLGSGAAGMQLWGKYNLVTGNDTVQPGDIDHLNELKPTAIAMYAPHKDQVLAFWQTLPGSLAAGVPTCTEVPYRGIDSPTLQVCITHLGNPPA